MPAPQESGSVSSDGPETDSSFPERFQWLRAVETVAIDGERVATWHLRNQTTHGGLDERIVRLSPTWGSQEATVSGEIIAPGSGYYDGSAHPIHLEPGLFIDPDFEMAIPTRGESRRVIASEYDGEPPAEAVDEAYSVAVDTFVEQAQAALRDELDIFERQPTGCHHHIAVVDQDQ